MSKETQDISTREQAAAAEYEAKGTTMPDAERAAYNREKLAGASRDADAWLNEQVQKLQTLTDVHKFHKQWDFNINILQGAHPFVELRKIHPGRNPIGRPIITTILNRRPIILIIPYQ